METPGRLQPVMELIAAARDRSPDLAERLLAAFDGLAVPAAEMEPRYEFQGEPAPAGLGASGSAVWHDTALVAVSSERPVSVSIDGGDPVAMTPVPGTTFWFALAQIATGQVHGFRCCVEGEWGPGEDFAGYNPSSYERPDVRPGTLSDPRVVRSAIYPGASTEYRLYANHGIDEVRGAPVMVWHDGDWYSGAEDLYWHRMRIVTDNLAHLGLIPPMVHVLVTPSTGGEEGVELWSGDTYGSTMRSLQYDTVSDRYGRHVVEEILPDAETLLKLRRDAYSRGTAGGSSGGICAFTLGWFHPGEFSRVHSVIGSYIGVQANPDRGSMGGLAYPYLVRREQQRNLRVWLSDGMNDFELSGGERGKELFRAGGLPLNNILLANALKGRGYDFHFRFGEGYHSLGQGSLDLPESLAWLWRDYDPDRTEQQYEQEPAEQEQPMYRVRIANRDAW